MLASGKPVLATSSSQNRFCCGDMLKLGKYIMLYQNVGQTSRAPGSYRPRRTLTAPVMLYQRMPHNFSFTLT